MTMDRNEAERVRRLVFDSVAVNVLQRVLGLAHRIGVAIAPVKGIVLARWLYERLEERPSKDIDLLISRRDLPQMTAATVEHGWTIEHQSREMGELEFVVDRVTVEIHAEMGRRDLSRLETDGVLSRARPDHRTFGFEVLRLDDIDHFFLLVSNVTKKTFTYSNPHQPADLERLAVRLEPRWPELADRAQQAALLTALRSVAVWMIEEHGSVTFPRLLAVLPRIRRILVPAAIRLYRRRAVRAPQRLESMSGLAGLALATLTPDDRSLRFKGVARLARRGLIRRLGRDPG